MKLTAIILLPSFIILLFFEYCAYQYFKANHTSSNKDLSFFYQSQKPSLAGRSKYLKKRSLYFTYHPILGVKFRPNSLVYGLSPDASGSPYFDERSALIIDKNGFVANENIFNQKDIKRAKQINIIITGGSTVSGWGATQNKKTWPARLEKKLNDLAEVQNKPYYFKIKNAGVFGYSISQELLYYLHDLRYHPIDTIISFNGINEKWKFEDTPQNYFLSYHHRNLIKALNKGNSSNTTGLLPNVRRAMKHLFVRQKDNQITHENVDHLRGDQLYLRQINTYAKIVLSDDIKFLHILQPTMGFCDKRLTDNEKKLQNFFGNPFYRNSWDKWESYIDELEPFYKRVTSQLKRPWHFNMSCLFKDEEKEVFHDPRHYNDYGQEIIANKVLTLLKENSLKKYLQ